jgi:hypothetical protein
MQSNWGCLVFHKESIKSIREESMKRFKLLLSGMVVLGLVLGASMAVAADLTGTWNLSVTSAGGTGNPTFVLKQTGDTLSGTYTGRFGEAPCTGTVKGNDVEIIYEMSGTKVVYKGKVDGNKMSGTVDFGGQGSGDFTGEKK